MTGLNENELETIKQRNQRVENDKAWETSWARKFSIAVMTYIVLVIYLPMLGLQKSYLHATVPVIGYLLSTLTLPVLKNLWLEKMRNCNKGSQS